MRGQGSARRAAAALLRGGPPTPGGGAAAVTAAHGPPNAAGERLRATSGRAESGDKLGGAGDWPAGWGGPGGGGGAGGFALSSGHSVFGGRGTAVDFYSLEFDGLLAIELERPHLLHGHGAAIHGIGSTTPSDAAVAAAAADAVTAAAVEAAAQAEAEADFYENVHEFSEEHTLVLRRCVGGQVGGLALPPASCNPPPSARPPCHLQCLVLLWRHQPAANAGAARVRLGGLQGRVCKAGSMLRGNIAARRGACAAGHHYASLRRCRARPSLPERARRPMLCRFPCRRRIRFLAALEEDGWELTSPVSQARRRDRGGMAQCRKESGARAKCS